MTRWERVSIAVVVRVLGAFEAHLPFSVLWFSLWCSLDDPGSFQMKLNPIHPVNGMQLNPINQCKKIKGEVNTSGYEAQQLGWSTQLTAAALAKGAAHIWQSNGAVTLTHNVQNHPSIIPSFLVSTYHSLVLVNPNKQSMWDINRVLGSFSWLKEVVFAGGEGANVIYFHPLVFFLKLHHCIQFYFLKTENNEKRLARTPPTSICE